MVVAVAASAAPEAVAVLAPEEARIRRIMARDGISEEYARARVRAQRDEAYFREHCDAVFTNDYPTLRDAEAAADTFVNQLLRQLKEDNKHG